MKKTSDPDFVAFWEKYPQRVGKLKAEHAYAKAKKRATADEILTGVGRYVRHKPDWQAWAHPATWLNAGRWMDEYESAPRPAALGPEYTAWECPHVDRHWNRGDCRVATNLGRPLKEQAS